MINLITLNGDGTEAFREQAKKGYRPLNGFERLINGDFVKFLSDPRCITDQERKQELERQERAKNSQTHLLPKAYHDCDLDDDDADQTVKARVTVHPARMIRVTEFLHCFESYGLIGSSGSLILNDVRRLKDSPIHSLNSRTYYARIVFDKKSKTLKAWYDDTSIKKGEPDLAIVSGIIWDYML